MKQLSRVVIMFMLSLSLSGCLGLIVGSAIDIGLEVAKVPFKVANAAVNVVSSDDNKKK
ncbi:MAG: hypothetical protein ABIP64_03320 [Burkholderiales bacterium]